MPQPAESNCGIRALWDVARVFQSFLSPTAAQKPSAWAFFHLAVGFRRGGLHQLLRVWGVEGSRFEAELPKSRV